jgi:hypothetical protein
MTIDERLEALTQTVELIAQMHKDNELPMARMMQSITRLSTITAVHDIDDHEHRLGDLENKKTQ